MAAIRLTIAHPRDRIARYPTWMVEQPPRIIEMKKRLRVWNMGDVIVVSSIRAVLKHSKQAIECQGKNYQWRIAVICRARAWRGLYG